MEEKVIRNGQTIGDLGTVMATPVVHTSPWAVALVTSVVGAVAGWTIEEVAKHARGRRRR